MLCLGISTWYAKCATATNDQLFNMPDRMLQMAVDFSLKSDSPALEFKGTSKDWCDYLPKLESHLDERNLADLAKLGVSELLMVQTDGSKQDAKRV